MNTEGTPDSLLFNVHRICTLPVGLGHFCQENAHDPLLFRVLLFKINGWFRTVDPKFATIGSNSGVGCLIWEIKIIFIFTVSKMDILIFSIKCSIYRWTQNLQIIWEKIGVEYGCMMWESKSICPQTPEVGILIFTVL